MCSSWRSDNIKAKLFLTDGHPSSYYARVNGPSDWCQTRLTRFFYCDAQRTSRKSYIGYWIMDDRNRKINETGVFDYRLIGGLKKKRIGEERRRFAIKGRVNNGTFIKRPLGLYRYIYFLYLSPKKKEKLVSFFLWAAFGCGWYVKRDELRRLF